MMGRRTPEGIAIVSMKKVAGIALLLAMAICAAGCRADDADATACTTGSGDPGRVVAACTRALDGGQDAPASRRAVWLMHRGLAKEATGDPAGALADLDAAVVLAPRDAWILANRGGLHGRQERSDPAIRDLDAALAIDPDNTLALGNRAIAHERRGEYRPALVIVERLMRLDPSNHQVWAERCWIGAVLAEDLPRARKDCERALAMEGRDPNNYNNLGFVTFRLHQYRESIGHYDQAIAKAPGVASSWLVRGLAKRAIGEEAGAAADIAKSAEIDPGVAARYAGYGIETGAGDGR
jgi:tetratricopeptide (TPR) repeat protein